MNLGPCSGFFVRIEIRHYGRVYSERLLHHLQCIRCARCAGAPPFLTTTDTTLSASVSH